MSDPVRPLPAPVAPTIPTSWFAPSPLLAPTLPRLQLPADFFTRDFRHTLTSEGGLATQSGAASGPRLDLPSPPYARASISSVLSASPATGFKLSGRNVIGPGDPILNPQIAALQQSMPKTLDLGPVSLGRFTGDTQGFAVGAVFGGVFLPDGVRLSAGLFANIPGLGSGVAAWRF